MILLVGFIPITCVTGARLGESCLGDTRGEESRKGGGGNRAGKHTPKCFPVLRSLGKQHEPHGVKKDK